ncbi:MAG: type 1 glutamine amidotransferase [Hyphomicrobiaceae bacterium]
MKTRILVIDGSPAAGQEAIVALGGARSGENYTAALHSQMPGGPEALDCFILAAADGERLPQGMQLTDFHGIAWTGSPLGAYESSPAVTGQIELARTVFQSGVPCFGSCWGLQVMAVALGGKVHLNPKGYEIGVARQIRLTDEGRAHPMYDGKASVFDAVCVHQDEVCELPAGSRVLAGNDVSTIQAVVIEDGGRSFWGVQYHPEFGLAQISALFRRRAARLVKDGLARTEGEVEGLAADFMALHHDRARRDLAWRYGIGRDVLDDTIHRREFANWIRQKVMPRVSA